MCASGRTNVLTERKARGDSGTRDAIEMWLDYKREREVQAMRLHSTPLEFHLYFDI